MFCIVRHEHIRFRRWRSGDEFKIAHLYDFLEGSVRVKTTLTERMKLERSINYSLQMRLRFLYCFLHCICCMRIDLSDGPWRCCLSK